MMLKWLGLTNCEFKLHYNKVELRLEIGDKSPISKAPLLKGAPLPPITFFLFFIYIL